jgi:tRNA pseudouridine38-40 synthase
MTEGRNVRLLISYDGTDFAGWQRQSRDRSVQGALETALESLHGHPVALHGSGRTDAGVHAAGQVANFRTSIERIPIPKFVPALNAKLPPDVRVLAAEAAADDFHARFDAKSRLYRYFVIAGRPALAHERRYAWQLWRRPDLALMNAYAASLLGETDCSTFASPQDASKSRHRHISLARWLPTPDGLVFEIAANAFLWKMVRSIVGSLLHYEERGLAPARFAEIVASGDRKSAGPTAPPEGLFLWSVDYYRL